MLSGDEARAGQLAEVEPSMGSSEDWGRLIPAAKESSQLLSLAELVCPTAAPADPDTPRLQPHGDRGRHRGAPGVGTTERPRAAGAALVEDDGLLCRGLDVAGSGSDGALGLDGSLDRLCTDRWMARAIRYAALRYRASEGGTSWPIASSRLHLVQAQRRAVEQAALPHRRRARRRARLYPHQLGNVHRILKDTRVRRMLADEVGLSKTVRPSR